jgi:hypothetical protein
MGILNKKLTAEWQIVDGCLLAPVAAVRSAADELGPRALYIKCATKKVFLNNANLAL